MAHAGMVQTATGTYENIYPFVIAELKKYPHYSLVIVGHSLGAAVATLLTIRFENEKKEIEAQIGYKLNLRCFAFAPPCSVSYDLSNNFKHIINSYIVGDDVVPRISFGSLRRLKLLALEIKKMSSSNFQRLAQAVAASGSLGENLSSKIQQKLDIDQAALNKALQGKSINLDDNLYPAGTLYHLLRSDLKTAEEDTEAMLNNRPTKGLWQMEPTNFSFFAEIIISSTMLTDHLPNTYETAFQGVLRKQNHMRSSDVFYFLKSPSPLDQPFSSSPSTPSDFSSSSSSSSSNVSFTSSASSSSSLLIPTEEDGETIII